jgi:hypothetical protein
MGKRARSQTAIVSIPIARDSEDVRALLRERPYVFRATARAFVIEDYELGAPCRGDPPRGPVDVPQTGKPPQSPTQLLFSRKRTRHKQSRELARFRKAHRSKEFENFEVALSKRRLVVSESS